MVFGNLELKRRSRRKTGSNIAKPQRRDFATSSRLLPQNHKKQMEPNDGGIEERTDWSTESREVATRIIGKDTVFVFFFFSDKLLMIYRLMCIFSSDMFSGYAFPYE